jgi:hypothetical protein
MSGLALGRRGYGSASGFGSFRTWEVAGRFNLKLTPRWLGCLTLRQQDVGNFGG